MALKKLTKTMLLAAYKEIDESVGVEPPIKESLSQDKYEKELYDTIIDLDLNKTEISGFDKKTQEVISALKEKFAKNAADDDDEDEDEDDEEVEEAPVKKGGKKVVAPEPDDDEEEEEDEPETDEEEEEEVEEAPVKKGAKKLAAKVEPEEDDEEEEVEETVVDKVNAAKKVSELLEVAKANPEFKKALKKLMLEKNAFKLKAAMLAIVTPEDDEEEEVPEKKIEKKVEKDPAKKKEGPKKAGNGGPGIIASILEFITESGKEGIAKENILKKLTKRFPDRAEASMKNTVNVQVPGKLSRDKGITISKTEQGTFYLKPEKKK